MNIQKLELLTGDLEGQKDFYASVLELPTELTSSGLLVKAGETELLFTQAPSDFTGAYHFAFNIPENQYQNAKDWITGRLSLLRDTSGKEDFHSRTWDSDSVYFLDPAGNVLEFIARHTLQNAVDSDFDSRGILNVSEIGLPSEDVIELADELTSRLGLSVYKQVPDEHFTPVGDENGLLILPIRDRIWMPDSGVPARMLPVNVWGSSISREWQVRGIPYEVIV
jgi:catechol-2,3-dioxygenase